MGKGLLIGISLIVVGIIIIMIAVLYGALKSGEAKYGGVIVIGPFPLIFGSDREAVKIAIIGAIILMVLAFILMFMPTLLLRRTG
jgi:uncharacterized protein (TIGR00304 family)